MRLSLITSNSVTAAAPLFSTSKVVGPDAISAVLGSQPASVSANETDVDALLVVGRRASRGRSAAARAEKSDGCEGEESRLHAVLPSRAAARAGRARRVGQSTYSVIGTT